ncbi:MAG: FGGY family carbohydrate kinase [Cyclobacteriaceae bacterium]
MSNLHGYLLGLDIGSSSVKASIVEISSGQSVIACQSPTEEMPMIATQQGWAEQDPNLWWKHVVIATKTCLQKSKIKAEQVLAVGLAYQMHGLVIVDHDLEPLRHSIIWCDSRAVQIGDKAFSDLGKDFCLRHFLNSPGNFTAAKLGWIKVNEPALYDHIYKIMLPGDFIAMKMTGEIATTESGLSEGIFWDFEEKSTSKKLMDYFGFDYSFLPTVSPTFSVQGQLSKSASMELGLKQGTPISYRAGDQPNNAFSLGALNPGETAATAGTSGVVYNITDQNVFDSQSRVNTFIHVNNTKDSIRNGVLLCVNGTGIQYNWLRKNLNGRDASYPEMNAMAQLAPIGADGISVLPFGNGAERILNNKEIEGSIHGLNFNIHNQSHVFRAAQEGIVFALKYGFDLLTDIGLKTNVIKAGNANMFLSPVFKEAFANTLGAPIELYDTDGAKGAALGAGVGAGIYTSYQDAFGGLNLIECIEPEKSKSADYTQAYQRWKKILSSSIQQ